MNRKPFPLVTGVRDQSPTYPRPLITVFLSLLALMTVIVGLLAAESPQNEGDNTLFLPIISQYREPNIVSFTSSETAIPLGSNVTLSWVVRGQNYSAFLTPGVGSVTGRSSVVVTPTETTTYTLMVQGPGGSDTATVIVEVVPPPQITSFAADSNKIGAGSSTMLTWAIAGPADTVTITPGIGDVTGQNSVAVTPPDTTRYTLTVVNIAGTDSAEITVTVVQPPVITSFTANPAVVNLGEEVTLSWSINGEIDTLVITPDIGDVTGQSSITFIPNATRTYTLTTTNIGGEDTAAVTVEVIPPPQIMSFTAANNKIGAGSSTMLTWSIVGPVDTVIITPGVGDVTGQSSVTVMPAQTTTYTLVATNSAGSASAQAVVTVVYPPVITEFKANPTVVKPGQETTLSWSINGEVDSLTITPNVGDVIGQSSVTFMPGETLVYTLTATNVGGQDTAQVSVAVLTELLVFDWNEPVTKSHHGFPWNQPPRENGNWVTPVNFANGTFYYRVQIFSQPEPQNMRLQFCFWQREDPEDENSYPYAREECGWEYPVTGNPGNVVTWSQTVDGMWQHPDGLPIDWALPRYRAGVAIKNSAGLPVSDFNGWDWNGEDPDAWYPLNMRFTVVVVAEGETFSGWFNYIP
jgi:hypothetical protein